MEASSGPYRVSRRSARFVNPEVEEAYMQSGLQTMLRGMSHTFFMLGTGLLCTLMMMVFSDYRKMVGVPHDAFTVERIVACLCCYLLALGARNPGATRFVGPRMCEGLVVVSLLLTLAMCFQTIDLKRQFSNHHSDDGLGLVLNVSGLIEKELQIALFLDAVITTTHLLMPARWCWVVWIDLGYVVGFSVHSRLYLGFWHLNIVLVFASLLCGSCLGLFMQEQTHRALFALVISERTQKAKAEFAAGSGLSFPSVFGRPSRNMAPDLSSVGGDSSAVSAVSMPTTTATNRFFSEARQSFDMDSSLLALEEMARSEHWLVDKHELQINFNRVLGRGRLFVLEGTFCRSLVAVKIFTLGIANVDRSLFSELGVMRHIRHPNIALFFGATIDTQNYDVKLVMEKIEGVDLSNYINDHARTVEELDEVDLAHELLAFGYDCLTVVKGLCEALIYLHSRRPCVIHGDLKLDNVMVEKPDTSPKAKLLDFGIARNITRSQRLSGGTQRYMAPEVLAALMAEGSFEPRPENDVFSLGWILHFVGTGNEQDDVGSSRSTLPSKELGGILEGYRLGEEPTPAVHQGYDRFGGSSLQTTESMTSSPQSQRIDFPPAAQTLPRGWKEVILACTSSESSQRPSVAVVHDKLCKSENLLPPPREKRLLL